MKALTEEKERAFLQTPTKGVTTVRMTFWGELNEKMKGSKTYVYEQIDKDGNVVKIGKTIAPLQRLKEINQYSKIKYSLKLIDVYGDLESYYIAEYKSKGYKLINKELLRGGESDWQVGDVVIQNVGRTNKRLNPIAVKDKKTNKVYSSIYKLSKDLREEGVYVNMSVLRNYLRGITKKSPHLKAYNIHNRFQLI